MKILLISCGNTQHDGRLRELIAVCRALGELSCITNDTASLGAGHDAAQAGRARSYPAFIRFCLKRTRGRRDFDLVLADNRKALLPAYLVLRRQKGARFVIDARELYLLEETKGFASRLGCRIEKYLNPKADLVIAANEERADIMQRYYALGRRPLVFENMRLLHYPEAYAGLELPDEIRESLGDPRMKFVSTAGCALARRTEALVEAAAGQRGRMILYLVGRSAPEELGAIRALIGRTGADNVLILDRNLNEGELKDFIGRCDVGVVNYSMANANNKYCASGKIYEFLAEGKPVLTTENPPLLNFVRRFGVGAADDGYTRGIEALLDHYADYRKQVEGLDVARVVGANNAKLAAELGAALREVKR